MTFEAVRRRQSHKISIANCSALTSSSRLGAGGCYLSTNVLVALLLHLAEKYFCWRSNLGGAVVLETLIYLTIVLCVVVCLRVVSSAFDE